MGRKKQRAGGGAAAEVLTTLADLYRDGRNVACTCRRCRHRAILATNELISVCGGTTTLRRLSEKLCCTKCGGRAAGASPSTGEKLDYLPAPISRG